MKRLFMILLAAGSVTFAAAQAGSQSDNYGQNDRRNSKDVVLGQSNQGVYKNNNADYDSYSNARKRAEQFKGSTGNLIKGYRQLNAIVI